MICRAIQSTAPNQWGMVTTDVNDIQGVNVKVGFSSLCGTDRDVLSGDLIYYRTGKARYPIVTGHEWCGTYDGQPVVGICILGCNQCDRCKDNKPIHCDKRREVGVVNKNGAHAEYIVMPEECLVPIPELLPKYALVEPLAVCVHALSRIEVDSSSRILISGYGCIGKLCEKLLNLRGYKCAVYDPRYTKDPGVNFDVILECSGSPASLPKYLEVRGSTILIFGFEYQDIDPSVLSANEISLVGTIGSTLDDFSQAASIMKDLEIDFFSEMSWKNFDEGLHEASCGQKVVFHHGD